MSFSELQRQSCKQDLSSFPLTVPPIFFYQFCISGHLPSLLNNDFSTRQWHSRNNHAPSALSRDRKRNLVWSRQLRQVRKFNFLKKSFVFASRKNIGVCLGFLAGFIVGEVRAQQQFSTEPGGAQRLLDAHPNFELDTKRDQQLIILPRDRIENNWNHYGENPRASGEISGEIGEKPDLAQPKNDYERNKLDTIKFEIKQANEHFNLGNDKWIIENTAALLQFKNSPDANIDWKYFQKVKNFALFESLRNRGTVSYLSPVEVKKEMLRLNLSGSAGTSAYPIAINGKTFLVEFPTNRATIKTVGGTEVYPFPVSLLPTAGRMGVYYDQHSSELRFGDDISPPNRANLPVIGGDAVGLIPDAELQNPAQETCSVNSSRNNCYMPAVALHTDRQNICSGTLISSQWVLSASHCFCQHDPTIVTIGAGIPDSRSRNNLPSLQVSFAGKLIHKDPDFCKRYNSADTDIDAFIKPDLALVKLKHPIIHPQFSPVALVGSDDLLTKVSFAEMASFGSTEKSTTGGKKMSVSVAISSKRCIESDGEAYENPTSEFGCLRGKELVAIDVNKKKDSCFADSGGGVYARLNDGRIALLAVVSRGLKGECGFGGIYSLVTTTEIREWLEKHVHDVRFADSTVMLAMDLQSSK
ncbi:MAG: trypsin-like serine protease [Planctomycetaceae bacterium]|nr:trypsin-like serine protease [Planctomycetaceae bacterium]